MGKIFIIILCFGLVTCTTKNEKESSGEVSGNDMIENKKCTLTIKRFNGNEIWKVTNAHFSITPKKDYFLINFWASSQSELLSEPLEDTYEQTIPGIELQTIIPKDSLKNLVGKKFEFQIEEMPEDTDENFSNFYYYGHDPTYYNRIEIAGQEGEYYHIKTVSTTTDVNYYDGSKPDNEIIVDCWIKKSEQKEGKWTL